MNLSACHVFGLLPIFALMLVGVSCQRDEAENNEIEVGRDNCTQQVANSLAQLTVPDGLDELVAHVNKFFPGMLNSSYGGDGDTCKNYVAIAHPKKACDDVGNLLSHAQDGADCFNEYLDINYPEYIEANITTKPLINAAIACEINEEFSEESASTVPHAECYKKLKDYLATYSLPKDVINLIYYVEESLKKLSSEDEPTGEYVAVDQPKGCSEVEDKLRRVEDDVPCVSELATAYLEYSEASGITVPLLDAIGACRINESLDHEDYESSGESPVFQKETA